MFTGNIILEPEEKKHAGTLVINLFLNIVKGNVSPPSVPQASNFPWLTVQVTSLLELKHMINI